MSPSIVGTDRWLAHAMICEVKVKQTGQRAAGHQPSPYPSPREIIIRFHPLEVNDNFAKDDGGPRFQLNIRRVRVPAVSKRDTEIQADLSLTIGGAGEASFRIVQDTKMEQNGVCS